MAESSSNKKSKTVDFELCFICQLSSKQKDYTNYVLHPSLPSLEKLITSTGVRCSCGETEFFALKGRISGWSADELQQKGVTRISQIKQKLNEQKRDMRREKQQAMSVT
ncbi:hypothetical protein SNE40_003759 [Patella caerulea]|uniref:Uncharacterized protein n=1 Tax=Patella caerulea TaxID=87958 RepID=A0AAN8Q165_PATCE